MIPSYDAEPGTCLTCGAFYCSCEVYADMYDEERRTERQLNTEGTNDESK